MEARAYLQQIKNMGSYINTLQAEIEVLWTRLTSTTVAPKEVNVITSKSYDNMTETLEKYMQAKDEINKVIENYLRLESEARKIVFTLHPLKYQTVLLKYYFQDMTFEKVADEMGISYQWACELHNRALEEFQKKIKKIEKSANS